MAESCGVAHQSPPPSPVAVPARVVPTSPPKSSEALRSPSRFVPRQESLHGVPTRVVQQAPPGSSGLCQSHPTSSPGSPALSESSAVIRRPCQSRPCPCQSPAKSADRPVGQGLSPGICAQSARQALSRMSRPRQTTVVRRPRRGRSPHHRL